MKIENINISELKPYERNPRINKEAVQFVANSIKEFGFKQPVVIDKNNIIIAGHTRYLASKKLKLKTVPCVYADDLTDEQVKAYRIADNSTAEVSQWDLDLLKLEIDEMPEIDFKADYGLDVAIEDVEEQAEIIEDEVPEINEKETIAQLGDIWQLGRHRLMCGDSTDAGSVALLMNGVKADMVLSDPPYGMFLDTDFSSVKGSMKSIGKKNNTQGNKYEKVIGDNEDFTPDLILTFFENFDCDEMFLFGADYFAEILPNKNEGSWLVWDKRKESQANAIGSEFELVWSKQKHKRRMLRHDWFGFLSSENSKDARNRVHPTQKPITLLIDIINQWGSEKSNIVDLFGGSGSTLIACEQTNRNCFMMELDPKYVDVILQRYYNLTGDEPVLVSTDDPITMSEVKESRGT